MAKIFCTGKNSRQILCFWTCGTNWKRTHWFQNVCVGWQESNYPDFLDYRNLLKVFFEYNKTIPIKMNALIVNGGMNFLIFKNTMKNILCVWHICGYS